MVVPAAEPRDHKHSNTERSGGYNENMRVTVSPSMENGESGGHPLRTNVQVADEQIALARRANIG